jgi:copper chaperone CopZ
MQTTRIRIDGMTCLTCVTHVQKSLEAIPLVKDVTVTLDEGAVVQHDGAKYEQLLRAIQSAGDYSGRIEQ